MTQQCSHETLASAPASAHASAHASVHESECSRECSRGCPRKCTQSGLVVCHLVCFHQLCSLPTWSKMYASFLHWGYWNSDLKDSTAHTSMQVPSAAHLAKWEIQPPAGLDSHEVQKLTQIVMELFKDHSQSIAHTQKAFRSPSPHSRKSSGRD